MFNFFSKSKMRVKALLLIIIILSVISCEKEEHIGEEPEVYLNKVELDKCSLLLVIDDTVTLNVVLSPSFATDKIVIWRSSDKNVATVDTLGKVKPLKPGVTNIIVSAKINNAIADTCSIRVFDTFTDTRDGNTYKIVEIGDQVWMAENLKYIPKLSSHSVLDSAFSKPVYFVYDYVGTNIHEAKKTDNYKTYGVLYNWFSAVNVTDGAIPDPSNLKGACPDGWHIPSITEWMKLKELYGNLTASKLKDSSKNYWKGTNYGVTNESGFTALPSGQKLLLDDFEGLGYSTNFWTSNGYIGRHASAIQMGYDFNLFMDFSQSKSSCYSVRCVRDKILN